LPNPLRVLITDRFDLDASTRLESDPRFEVRRSATPFPSERELEGIEALVIRSRTSINAELLRYAPCLQLLITATSGFDHIDLKATSAQAPRLKVMHTPEANAASACELTWALVLACTRRLQQSNRALKAGDWTREALIGQELRGKTYGVVGLGRIGSRVARIASAFDMQVVAFDPYRVQFPNNVSSVAFEELLRLSDVISFHVPASAETRHMLNQNGFAALNRQVIVVNTSRGSVIRERDLIQALTAGKIFACGLDVFEREPLPRDSTLLTFPNVVLTPHVGATTSAAFAAASHEAVDKLVRYVESGATSDLLPPNAPWFSAIL
jgi:D-3-phosphoglycerate dehydrogenase